MQATILANFAHSNASWNYNSPKCIVVAKIWTPKEEFLQLVEDILTHHPYLPVAYYPGIEQRFASFVDKYEKAGKAKKLYTVTGKEEIESGSKPDRLGDSVFGRRAASSERCFKTEPFTPMYTVTTLKGTSQDDVQRFCDAASTFCNDYLFGTSSGSITMPPVYMLPDKFRMAKEMTPEVAAV